ncbi:MAG TPA: HlyD family efflux transporter periplasmic adaptor subunit [Lacipirellulaceae bacterium]|nr:HlyD family efflux transporter periplasmic adaptor subunit [Lacipirellulaceae bacterium]
MVSESQPSEAADSQWIDFENSLGEMARLAKSGMPFDRLAQTLLDETVHILAAVGGAVWLGSGASSLRLQHQVNYHLLNGEAGESFHPQLLEFARTEGETVVVPPGGVTVGTKSVPNPTDYTLLVAPLSIDQQVVGFFEVIQRSTTSAAAVRGNRRLLALVSELAADHLRRQEIRELRDERLRTQQFEALTERIHGSIDLRTVAYEVANGGRQLIECDRVSIAVRKGRRFKVIAISGVDSANRRSNAVRRLEELAARVAVAGEAVWHDDGASNDAIAPQIAELLQGHADEVHPRTIGVIPLTAVKSEQSSVRAPVVGVLIVEQFSSVLDSASRERATSAARHSGLAVANALRYESLPTIPFLRRRSEQLAQRGLRMSIILPALTGVVLVASLFVIPMTFNVHAEGDLQPEQQQHLFAPFEGQVAAIRVEHGQRVAANDVLIELRSTEIDLESQRIQGEFDVTQKRIAAIESSLLQIDNSDDEDIARMNQLAAEQEELRQLLSSQQEQLATLRSQREKLIIRSPMDGQVLTWDLEKSLADRPVQRGQLLLSVANLKGPWVAELDVPDDEIGHLLSAQTSANATPVTFQLATNRGVDFRGVIRRIASRTESGADDRPLVRVTVDVDEKEIGELRPGATIFAKINCGKRKVAYVWFHDVVDAVHSWISF